MHSCNLCGKSFRRKHNLQRYQVSCAIGRGRKKADPSSKFICKVCGKEPYVVERLVAEKSWWHKNCFR